MKQLYCLAFIFNQKLRPLNPYNVGNYYWYGPVPSAQLKIIAGSCTSSSNKYLFIINYIINLVVRQINQNYSISSYTKIIRPAIFIKIEVML